MLKAELRKTWSRPLIAVAFLLVCLAQILYVFMNCSPQARELSSACNAIGGQMDDQWRQSVRARYEELWETPPESGEDMYSATLPQRAILTAYDYTFFTEMLDSYVNTLDQTYGGAAAKAYAGLREASESGRLVFGTSPAGEIMKDQYMVGWGFLIFMMLLCVDQFSGEREIGMSPMQRVTKQGRRKLFRTKLLVCQLSGAAVWAASNLTYALTLTARCGWGNLQSVIQDFSFNACPYDWNAGEYLAITLLTGLAASQLTGLAIFLLARTGRSTQRSFALMGGILILPYLLAFLTKHAGLALWLPCLLNGQWLWSGLRILQIGGWDLQLWSIAAAELMLVAVIAVLALRRLMKTAETMEETKNEI